MTIAANKKRDGKTLWCVLLFCSFIGQAYGFGMDSGGATSIAKTGANAFSMPAANLSFEQRLEFSVGNSFFRNPWVLAPATTTARDGLGPFFNTNACQNCHIKDGRGHLPSTKADNLVSALVRISLLPDSAQDWVTTHEKGAVSVPNYGLQLQDFARPGLVPKAKISVSYEYSQIALADGSQIELRKPRVVFSQWGYGAVPDNLVYSLRIAPPMIGLGLLEAVTDKSIETLAQQQIQANSSISGKVSQVWDHQSQSYKTGRFGWKAEQPNLRQQNAAAFLGDMGITSTLFKQEPCPPQLEVCKESESAGEPEVSDKILDKVTFYSANLAVPKRRNIASPEVIAGQKLFVEAQCSQCHVPQLQTGPTKQAGLSEQVIHPYTDLLLHDMGPGLADGRPVFNANGAEWRTPPLWGIGLTAEVSGQESYLHDGRARTLLEAILWHGGEAKMSQQRVVNMAAKQRSALVAFLRSL